MKRFFLENWQAKLMSLIIATAVWYLIKKNVDSFPDHWPSERPAGSLGQRASNS